MKNRTEKKLSRKTLEALEQIALAADYGLKCRGDIQSRDNDSEDYPEVSIRAIQAMLENAYRLGREDGKKEIRAEGSEVGRV